MVWLETLPKKVKRGLPKPVGDGRGAAAGIVEARKQSSNTAVLPAASHEFVLSRAARKRAAWGAMFLRGVAS